MSYRFTALTDFESEETKSHYVSGLSYTVRDGNDKLHGLVQRWISEGRVTLGEPGAVPAAAEMGGAGKVGG